MNDHPYSAYSPEYPMRVRSVFISDVHLGTRECQAHMLLDFLHSVRCDQLYLVGDIIDMIGMSRSVHWPQEHTNVIRSLLGKAKHNTEIIYVPGNHDAFVRSYSGQRFARLRLASKAVHVTATGKRFLVIHGDAFDGAVRTSKWLKLLGGGLYLAILRLNNIWNRWRQKRGGRYWSLSAYIKRTNGQAGAYIARFENTVAAAAGQLGYDGVICGHIHHANQRDIDGVTYINDGDWVENCTALVEDMEGNLQIVHWPDAMAQRHRNIVPVKAA